VLKYGDGFPESLYNLLVRFCEGVGKQREP
jgi:hypothetical protein